MGRKCNLQDRPPQSNRFLDEAIQSTHRANHQYASTRLATVAPTTLCRPTDRLTPPSHSHLCDGRPSATVASMQRSLPDSHGHSRPISLLTSPQAHSTANPEMSPTMNPATSPRRPASPVLPAWRRIQPVSRPGIHPQAPEDTPHPSCLSGEESRRSSRVSMPLYLSFLTLLKAEVSLDRPGDVFGMYSNYMMPNTTDAWRRYVTSIRKLRVATSGANTSIWSWPPSAATIRYPVPQMKRAQRPQVRTPWSAHPIRTI